MNKTIFALATAPLTSALAIIRVSGDKSLEILQNIFSKKIDKLENGKVLYGFIINGEKRIDEVLILTFANPKSFTGEDMFEISCHGGLVIIEEIIKLLIKHGAVLAEKGEFTRRAFYNNKLDLVQAESINDLIHSTSSKSKEIALNNLEGKVSNFLNDINEDFNDIIAQINVNIDYPEYKDIEDLTTNLLTPRLEAILEKLNNQKDVSAIGKMINEGVKVAIIGKPNVGKSTLLNALIKLDKAITSDIPGTTRDIVEGRINLSGITFNFLDTAGIRNTDQYLERKGIDKSFNAIDIADIVIVVLDQDIIDEEDQLILDKSKNKNRIIVRNKKDLSKKQSQYLSISAISGDVLELEQELVKFFQGKDYQNESLLTNSRQISELEKSIYYLELALEECRQLLPPDLIIININLAQIAIKNILGLSVDEDAENAVFSRFCVGK